MDNFKNAASRLLTRAKALLDKADAEKRGMSRDELAQYEELIDAVNALQQEERDGRVNVGAESREVGAAGSWMQIERRALTTTGTGAEFAPTVYGATFFDKLSLGSPILNRLSRLSTDGKNLVLPIVKGDPTTYFATETSAITASDGTYATLTCTVKKAALYQEFSAEVFADSPGGYNVAEKIIPATFERSARLATEAALFEGATNGPVGIKATSGIQAISTATGTDGGSLTNFDAMADGMKLLLDKGVDPSRMIIVAHPREYRNFIKIKEGSSSNKALLQIEQGGASAAPVASIYGVPLVLCSQLSQTETKGASSDCGSIYVMSTDAVVWVVHEPGVQLVFDRSVKFQNDVIAARLTWRYDFGVVYPDAIVRISGLK